MKLNAIKKIILVLCLALALIISQTACEQKQGAEDPGTESSGFPVYGEGYYLDTICQITIYSLDNNTDKDLEQDSNQDPDQDQDDESLARNIIDNAFDQCELYEGLLSKTIETSDISKINSSGSENVSCDPRTVELIRDGMMFGYLSDGSFNIGIGALTELWDFHAMNPVVPDDSEIKKALEHVHDCSIYSDYMLIDIDEDENVYLDDPDAKLDLGGIAKGYIADRITEYLVDAGVTGGVVDLGGNIVVIGYKDGEEETTEVRVGIKKPYTETNEIVGVASLHDACVVTSGVYERYFEVDGIKYHHILDPKTGYPKNSGLESVTVIGDIGTSETCDALATTVLMNGEDWIINQLEYEKNASDMGAGGFVYLNGFTYILIRDDGSIETLGSDRYTIDLQS